MISLINYEQLVWEQRKLTKIYSVKNFSTRFVRTVRKQAVQSGSVSEQTKISTANKMEIVNRVKQ